MSIYDYNVSYRKKDHELEQYKDNVLLVVNTASKCGFSPQYSELEEMYQQYKDQGFQILAFPCNQFGNQEPGNDEQIQEYCTINHGVTFPVMDKVDVNGKDADPLYKYLSNEAPGVLGSKSIKWNFTKFLIDRDGKVVGRFAPKTKPSEMHEEIQKLL
ncbi:glutathione peroxidase [Longirhabdus pacifica]|uniref:glutathione peroxidase n=1 Tax=Longirhabdus pacifica TaxID=2305227 RepID=UPI0010091DD1|nr:glutathione peroxidase [Longirhabdus pacifica]